MHTSQLQSDSLDAAKCRLVSWLCGVPEPLDPESADEFIRTVADPSVYKTVQWLNQSMEKGGSRFIRVVAEWMGYNDVVRVFPQTEETITAFKTGDGDVGALSQAYREFAVLAALFDEAVLYKLYSAVLSASSSLRLQDMFQLGEVDSVRQFNEKFQYAKKMSELDRVYEREPEWIGEVQPIHVSIRNEGKHFRIPAHVRVFDPLLFSHDMLILDPEPVERFDVDPKATIPRNRVQQGMQLELSFPNRIGTYGAPERFFLTKGQMTHLSQKGSAVHTRIGRNDEIRFYPEYTSDDMNNGRIYEDSLASVRVTPQYVEIRKLALEPRLTVFV
ncbi:MAG: hypothetical protein ABIG66_05250 [Candidatus Kerfeldbacteria bacterium]